MKVVFTNEECQVMVHAVNQLARIVGIIAEHIYDNLDDETFAHCAEPFKDCAPFVKATNFQLDKIKKRLQS